MTTDEVEYKRDRVRYVIEARSNDLWALIKVTESYVIEYTSFEVADQARKELNATAKSTS